ncbi:MAG: transposase [Pseudomonadota bacterium]
MANYRRPHAAGATWFFTVALAERRGTQLLVEHVAELHTAIRTVMARHPFQVDAMVVLPEHLHCLWTLPPEDGHFATRWSLIKANFSRALPVDETRSASRLQRGERGIWQRRFWEHLIRDETDFARHVDYIHWNPVKHGHVSRAGDWPYSSFHRYVREGKLPADWGGTGETGGDFGEPRG